MQPLPYGLPSAARPHSSPDVGAAVSARHPFEEDAMSISYRVRAAAVAAMALASPVTGKSQAVIKVNDSVSVRFGILSQTWVDFTQTSNVFVDDSYTQDIFLRRMRFLVTGQIGS